MIFKFSTTLEHCLFMLFITLGENRAVIHRVEGGTSKFRLHGENCLHLSFTRNLQSLV